MVKTTVFCLAAGMACAQNVRLTVNTGSVLHGIDERIYGQSVDGSVWGEMVRNQSFEEAPGMRHWRGVGAGEALLDTDAPLNGRHSLLMVARDTESGIEQPGVAVRAGDTLRGSLWLAGTGTGVVVRLVGGGRVLAEQKVDAPGTAWNEYPLLFHPAVSSGNATLRILARPHSVVKVDQVSLMADSCRANGGFRPDVTRAIAALRPPIMRWSREVSERWKEGIGPQGKRPGNSLGFGADEFLAFARRVGAEPVIAVWTGPRDSADRAAYVQEAVDLVAYCNGPRDSIRGKVRAQNGHPEPYGVKYWQIEDDNVEVLRQFVSAMKGADPKIRIIAGDAALPVDFLSIPYEGLEAGIAQSKNRKLRLFVSEGKAQSGDWRDGLRTAGMLNAMEREEAVGMGAAPALAFDQGSWLPTADYVVRKLYRDYFAPDALEISGDAGGLNAVATRSADGDRIYVKLVNASAGEAPVDVVLRGDFPLLAAGMQVVAPDSLAARNTVEQPATVKAVAGQVERTGLTARLRLPLWSVAVVTLSR